jgi:hypothetical protein
MVASESTRLRYVFGLDECVWSSEKEKRDSQPLFIVPPDRTNCLRLAGNVGTGSKSLTPKLWDLPVDRFGGPTDFVLAWSTDEGSWSTDEGDSQPLFIVPPDRTNCLRLSGNVRTGLKSLTPKLWDLPVDRFGGPTDFVCLSSCSRLAWSTNFGS